MSNTTKIRDVMTHELTRLEADRSVAEAARRMSDDDIGDVLVTENGNLLGILTDRDVVVRCIASEADPQRTRVGEVCTKELVTISPDDSIDDAVSLMGRQAIRRLPVVEDGRPVGVVSLGDLAQILDVDTPLGVISAAPPSH